MEAETKTALVLIGTKSEMEMAVRFCQEAFRRTEMPRKKREIKLLTEQEQLLHEIFGRLKPRDPERIDKILKIIRRIWNKHPDMRLMQLLLNCATKEDEPARSDRKHLGPADFAFRDMYHVEDHDLVERIHKVYVKKQRP